MTFVGHLEELRRRLAISLLAVLLGVAISLARVDHLLGWLEQPARHLLWRLAFFSPTEPLLAYMKVGVLSGVIIAMPVVLWQVWLFVRSGLTERERSYGLAFIGWGSLQFVLGAALAYYGLLPTALRVLFSIGRGRLEPVISIDQYVSFVTTMMFWSGVVFELPVALFFLARAGVVTPAWLQQQRGYAILSLAIIAALVTPTTDIVSLLLMLGPMMALYEVSIWATHLAARLRHRR